MRFIALLRGVNVTGRNRVPMADLRDACETLGWGDVRTFIQSGNVVFHARTTATEAERALEEAVARRFGLAIPVIVRSSRQWSGYVRGNPFPEASASEPNLVMLALSKKKPAANAEALLLERAATGERVRRAGDAIWIHFSRGVARSKLSPGMLDRIAGSPVTTRNWRTVLELEAMAVTVR